MSRLLTQNRKTGQIITAVLCLVLMFGLMAPGIVNADSVVGTDKVGSLTISKEERGKDTQGNPVGIGPVSGAGFTLYKIMNLTPGNTAGEFADFSKVTHYNVTSAPNYQALTPDVLKNYSAKKIEALVDELLPLTRTDNNAVTQKYTGPTGQVKFEGIPVGYYLVVETDAPEGYVAGKPFFVSIPSTNAAGTDWNYNVTVEPKNDKLPFDKYIINKDDEEVKADTQTVGHIVDYVIRTSVPNFADEYFNASEDPIFRISDTMSPGLTYQKDGTKIVKVNGTAITTGYTWTDDNANGFTISFDKAFLQANKGAKVEVFYGAKLNENAIVTGSNPNDAKLEYSNKPNEMSKVGKIEDKTDVYTFEIGVEKFTNEGTGITTNTALAGAKFKLYLDEKCETEVTPAAVVTSDANGVVKFHGVEEGTYYLKEIEAPAGYKLLTNPIKIKITAEKPLNGKYALEINDNPVAVGSKTFISRILPGMDNIPNGTAVIAVQNHKGFSLPETGGMGIMIFLAIGLIGIVAVSIAMMRSKKKAGARA